jgi:hypothetical protein
VEGEKKVFQIICSFHFWLRFNTLEISRKFQKRTQAKSFRLKISTRGLAAYKYLSFHARKYKMYQISRYGNQYWIKKNSRCCGIFFLSSEKHYIKSNIHGNVFSLLNKQFPCHDDSIERVIKYNWVWFNFRDDCGKAWVWWAGMLWKSLKIIENYPLNFRKFSPNFEA